MKDHPNVSWWGGDEKTPMSARAADERRDSLLRTLALAIGVRPPTGAAVLDFGCGDGALVEAFARAGFDAWGAETNPKYIGQKIKQIDLTDGLIPFPADRFDLVVSYTVLEHVSGSQAVQFDEFARVLRQGGTALHLFPPKFGIIESHTMVPFAGVLQNDAWLRLWALCGIRAPHQAGLDSQGVAEQNARFLAERTNYLSRAEYLRLGRGRFTVARFVEREFVAAGRHRRAAKMIRMPGLERLYSGLRFRVMLLHRPKPFSSLPKRRP